jgi:MFS family permease
VSPRGNVQPVTAARRGPLDGWRAIAALLWLGFVGMTTFQLIPLMTDQLADVYGFSDARAGLISSWYCGAGFIASLFAFYWLPRWDRKPALFAFLAVGVVAEFSSLFVHSYAALAAGRVLTGFAAGSITCLVLSAITRASRAEHIYGLYTATISLFAAAGFIVLSYSLPALRDTFGDGALFAVFTVVWLIGFAAAALVPRGTTSDPADDGASAPGVAGDAAPAASRRPGPKLLSAGVLVLIASPVIFYIANGGSWAYIGRVGTWTGLSDGQVGIALAVSNVFAIMGGLFASWQGLRFRIVGPLWVGIVLTMSANIIMLARWGMAGYSVANVIGFFFTVYTVAVFLLAFGSVDPSGRLMASGGLAVYGGGALGPVILSQFIPAGSHPSYVGALIADAVVFLIAPLVFMVGWAMIRKQRAEIEAAGEPAVQAEAVAAVGGPDAGLTP